MENYGQIQNYASTSYGSLPIYGNNQQTQIKRRSRCPRGALLNQIGSCCGDQCTRACASPSD